MEEIIRLVCMVLALLMGFVFVVYMFSLYFKLVSRKLAIQVLASIGGYVLMVGPVFRYLPVWAMAFIFSTYICWVFWFIGKCNTMQKLQRE